MGLPKRKVVFQPSIFRCYVGSQEGMYCIGSNFKGTSLKTLQLNNLKLFWLKLVFESSFKRCLVHRFSMWGSTRVRTWKNRRKAFCSHGKSLRKKKKQRKERRIWYLHQKYTQTQLVLQEELMILCSPPFFETKGTSAYQTITTPPRTNGWNLKTSTQTTNFWVQNVSFGGCNSNMINR